MNRSCDVAFACPEPTAQANGAAAHCVSAAAATPDGAAAAAKDAAAALLNSDGEQRKAPSVAELLSQRCDVSLVSKDACCMLHVSVDQLPNRNPSVSDPYLSFVAEVALQQK